MRVAGRVVGRVEKEGNLGAPGTAPRPGSRAGHESRADRPSGGPVSRLGARLSRSDQGVATDDRLRGGSVAGGWRRGGNSARSCVVAAAMHWTAFSKASSVAGEVSLTPLTLRTN